MNIVTDLLLEKMILITKVLLTFLLCGWYIVRHVGKTKHSVLLFYVVQGFALLRVPRFYLKQHAFHKKYAKCWFFLIILFFFSDNQNYCSEHG